MNFSQVPYQNAISKNEIVPAFEIAYYRQRFRQHVFTNVASKFAERAKSLGITKSKIAALLGKDPAIVNRILSIPSNMTLDTISDFALALGYEPEIQMFEFCDDPRHNFSDPFTVAAIEAMKNASHANQTHVEEYTDGYIVKARPIDSLSDYEINYET